MDDECDYNNIESIDEIQDRCHKFYHYLQELNEDNIVSQIYELLVETTQENFTSAIIIYSIVYFVCVSLSVPVASYLTLIGGAIFNWIALPLVVLSATFGAIVIFLLSRGILANYFSKKIKGNFENLKIGFRKNNFFYILFLRLVPFAPFFVINILAGIMLSLIHI